MKFLHLVDELKEKFWTPWWLLLLVLPATWVLLFDDGLLTQRRLKEETQGFTDQAETLQKRIAFEQHQNQRIRESDPLAIEEEARRAGMVRPGDEVYHLVLESDSTAREKK